MCGRYYVDDSTFREVEKLIVEINGMLRKPAPPATGGLGELGGCSGGTRSGYAGGEYFGDLHPGDLAPVLGCGTDGTASLEWQHWGLPGMQKGSLIFNARSETVVEKPMFREGIAHHRIVVPARKFYEWNRTKEKITFLREDSPVLYLAGFYDLFEDGAHFVILTTQANASMKQTHDRMPLILEKEEAKAWLRTEEKIAPLLEKTPPELDKRAEYEQISFL